MRSKLFTLKSTTNGAQYDVKPLYSTDPLLPDGFSWTTYLSTLQTHVLGRALLWAESLPSSYSLCERLVIVQIFLFRCGLPLTTATESTTLTSVMGPNNNGQRGKRVTAIFGFASYPGLGSWVEPSPPRSHRSLWITGHGVLFRFILYRFPLSEWLQCQFIRKQAHI